MPTNRARGSAFDFFYRNSTPPDGHGRAAYARILADCERYFFDNALRVEWQHVAGTRLTRCALLGRDGAILGHTERMLGAVTAEHARVVRAEMVAHRRGLL